MWARFRRAGTADKSTIAAALIVSLLIMVAPLTGAIVWALQDEIPVDMLVYDATVATPLRKQHRSVDLATTYMKIPFDTNRDYVGADPGGFPYGNWPEEQPELIVLADAYGVYVNRDGDIDENGTVRVSQTFPMDAAIDIARWERDGAIVMGEFNVLHEPTAADVSEVLQDVFSINATGWTGRAFHELQDASDALKELHPRAWDYTGPGILLVGTSAGDETRDSEVVVLLPEHLDAAAPVITGQVFGEGDVISLEYNFWFALIESGSGADTDMWLELPVNNLGRDLLGEHGVPTRTPFMVRTENTLYIAGNVSTTPVSFPLRRIAGSAEAITYLPLSSETEMFYEVYMPMFERLVEMTRE